MTEFIEKLPKAELHLHIEGSLEPELMFELAKRNNIELAYSSVEELRKAYDFSDLQSFLDIYYQGAGVLLKEEDFYDLTMAYFKKCHEDSVVHAEIFFDPQTHTDRGIDFSVVMAGLTRAVNEAKSKYNISSYLIMCFLRHLSEEDAYQILKQAEPFKKDIIAVGLDSSEVGHPPSKFAGVFQKAREQGYLAVAHAGEEGPPAYIWEALELLKVKRIDHGVRSLEDEKLVKTLVDQDIPLTVCPLSNVKLRVFDSPKSHNLKELMASGLNVSIHSDDPAYFGGYMNDNFISMQEALSLDEKELKQLAINSFRSSFLPESEKTKWISHIENI